VQNKIPFKLILKNEAKLDIQDAFLWYESKSEGLGQHCVDEIEHYLSYIKENPYSCEARYGEYRVAVLKIFPYIVVYRIDENEIVVISIFATSQNPNKLKI